MNKTSLDLDFKWRYIRYWIKEIFNQRKLPDLNSVLLSIGINELGWSKEEFSKEEKQDLMHVGICTVLSKRGYYEFSHRDDEGWPHFDNKMKIESSDLTDQELLLKESIIEYFEDRYDLDYD